MLPELAMLDNFRHLHLIGIGGSGISALAYLALNHGLKVSGSDVAVNPTIESLKKEGAEIYIGHRAENLSELCERVIYTEAIDKKNNPEYQEALARGIPAVSYFKALGELSANKKTIVVTGTHGKTTTTAMLGQALTAAGLDPTVVVGSRVPAFSNRNVRFGRSEWLVAEGCEYRRSFLHFQPFGMVLLNCELEHVDYYKSESDYVSAFQELAAKIPEDGFLVYNEDDRNSRLVSKACRGKKLPVKEVDALSGPNALTLKVPGRFNRMNAAHALMAAIQVTKNTGACRQSLEAFTGTARRMEVKGEKNGLLVMDDYGHHPTEVRATLEALKQAYPDRRLICVFQPHQYSRTHELLSEFTKAFGFADMVIIPNIFEARDTEADKAKISAEKLAQVIGSAHPDCRWGVDFENTLRLLQKEALSNDLILTMGAGDVYLVGERFLFS